MKKRQIERLPRPSGPWTERVLYADQGLFAYRPRQIIVGVEAVEQAAALVSKLTEGVEPTTIEFAQDEWLVSSKVPFDVPQVIAELATQGVTAEPNVVYFNHSCGCSCGGGGCGGGLGSNPFNSNPFNSNPFNSNPFNSNPFNSNPFNSNPFNSNPFNSNPFNSNPFNSNPFNSNGWATTGERPSSARPATKPVSPKHQLAAGPARVIVLDTGIATKSQIPSLLKQDTHTLAPDHDRDVPDAEKDGFLDPSSGHGTFIAGLIEQLAPGHEVRCIGVLNTLGEGDATVIANRIDELLFDGLVDPNTIVNMSFGSYGDLQLSAVARAVQRLQAAGAVVVASAGNDGTCLPSFPAAFPDVVSVGSIEPTGRAPYSNHGPWVRACAPGTKVVSAFFKAFDGDIAPEAGIDIDDFRSWAEWTGTSFAGPVVAAALVRHMDLTAGSAQDAVDALVDGPSLGRYPGLGTVINLAAGS